jgi:hypothetical protein
LATIRSSEIAPVGSQLASRSVALQKRCDALLDGIGDTIALVM